MYPEKRLRIYHAAEVLEDEWRTHQELNLKLCESVGRFL
jgi:hypothetical protein